MDSAAKGKSERLSIAVLLIIRVCILLFCVILAGKTEGPLHNFRDVVLLSFGIYHILAVLMYLPVMSIGLARILFCAADLLIALMTVYMTGGIHSPLFPCVLLPIFTLHFLYRLKGLVLGLLGCAVSAGGILLASGGIFPASAPATASIGVSLGIIGAGIILCYIVPYLISKQYLNSSYQLKDLEQRFNDLDDLNSKLLMLHEMTGRFSFENGISQVMDRLLAVCNDLFQAESICIFLIRSGEVEIYGNPAPEEKESIYQLIMEQKKNNRQEEGREYIFNEDSLVIPLIRGARTDGVLSLKGWKQNEISHKEAILFSMIANMVCTYLENLEYVEALQAKHIPDTGILLNHLDSGKPVKGILDKRIVGCGD